MDEPHGTTEPAPSRGTASPVGRKGNRGLLWGLIAVVLAFLAGFGWQFYRATTLQDQLTQTEQELLVERVRVRLAQAAIAASAGDFESSRQQMSELFEVISDTRTELPDSVRVVADELLAMRDEVITGLSRSNPEYAGVLYGVLERMRTVARRPTPTEPEPEPAVPADSPAGAAGAS